MAKKSEGRVFNVSVIGLSGTEREKGLAGVGKSCLCNRFMHPLADDYHTDHISVLSQSDFGGRVINNDHFLYWGETTKTDEGSDFTFHVVEQTEFVDDVSFQPFRTGRIEAYTKRCATTKVQSAEKLMYICKEQLGIETDSTYEQKLMPEGRLNVDGFLCVFDVSVVQQRPLERQVEFITNMMANVIKTKKPIVMVTTKNDDADERYCKEVEKLCGRKEFRGNVPLVETSAHNNVNVELAFMTLAHLIDKTKTRTKNVPYADAARARKEILDVAVEAYRNLLRSHVIEAKSVWATWRKKFETKPDYIHYVELFGTDKARKLFRQHCNALREDQVRKREQHFLSRLPDILQRFLPSLDVISDRSWPACQRYIRQHRDFDSLFVDVCPEETDSWKYSNFVDNYEETRLPFDLLKSPEAETYFRNHMNALQAQHKKLELKKQFKELLEESGHVTPGKPLSEAYVFFVGKECFNSLEEHERLQVYDSHQAELRMRTRDQFQELLWEKTELFTQLNPTGRLTPLDLKEITNALETDYRYKVLHRLEEDRKVMILNHLGFIQCPSRERCYFKDTCIDVQVAKVLAAKAIRPEMLDNRADSSSLGERPMNLVLLGQEPLATQVYKEIRHLCPEDEYMQGSIVYSLDYRPIDGDVTLAQNSFATVKFKPHGCFCAYNSQESFEYMRASLENTLLADLECEEGQQLQGMPIVIIQAHSAALSKADQDFLEEEGRQLAKKLHSDFINIPVSEPLTEGKAFYMEQIEQALQSVISGRNCSHVPQDCVDSSDADIRVAICMMCGDPYSVEIPLGPLLSHEFCRISSDSDCSISLETYLDYCKQKVQVTFLSYHGASMRKNDIYHGYILVYSAHRKASLATMKAFTAQFLDIPVLILSVTESGGASTLFSDGQIHGLIVEGNGLADDLHGKFMTTPANFKQQTAAYNPFFKECWERKEETESLYHNLYQNDEDASPPPYYRLSIARRPPLPPPISPMPQPPHPDLYGTAKSSTSNSQSTEDSEPLYDQPGRYHSDSEHDRASSTSPPPGGAQSTNPYAVSPFLYHAQNGERQVRPSQLKHRRDVYAGDCMSASLYDTATHINEDWVDNSLYEHVDVRTGMPIKPKRLDMSKFGQVTEFMSHSLGRGPPSGASRVQAPLAMPEQIEIGDYATVRSSDRKDAVPENDYASVQDALPDGRFHRIRSSRKKHNKGKGLTDSDSELSSLERNNSKDIYSKVNRKPTPHKKKSKSREHASDERYLGVHCPAERVQSISPSEESDGTGDELLTNRKEKKKRPSVRKRWKSGSSEKSGALPGRSPPMSDSDYVGSPPGRGPDEDNAYEPINPQEVTTSTLKFGTTGSTEDTEHEAGEGIKGKFRPRHLKDPEKIKKKEEKRLKEEERKRLKEQKEEEKKRNREDMKRLKFKRKDGKLTGASQSGYTLEDHQSSTNNPRIPLFVEMCVQYIQEEGMQAEGIYRVPGNKAQVDLLISKFHEDSNLDISSLDIQVNAVATALKGFFSDLIEPLIPPSLYEELFEAARIPQKSCKLVALRGVLRKIRSPNYEVLRFLITHLNRVSQNAEFTNMDCRNLGVCWWPTLLRQDIASLDKITEVSNICVEVVHLLIEQAGFFFYNADEV
ncbi:rho GTPase-activating protein 35-like isoform X2 [Liolophura sinensis]|uniref:rho GTPase-activating protein 35-like isoform X2 n=1 Tax=Liolophura sinensis TaxID=3198878 RepID=UPI003158F15B